jgi:hypothetical protein
VFARKNDAVTARVGFERSFVACRAIGVEHARAR